MSATKHQRLLRTIVEAIATAADLNIRPAVLALDLALITVERSMATPTLTPPHSDSL